MSNNPVWKELISKKGQMDLKAPFSGKNVPSLITKDKSVSSSPKNFKQSFMKNDQNAFKYNHNSKLSGRNVARNQTQTQGSPIHNNFNNSTKVDKYEKILTPNIRKSVKDEENVKFSPDSQKVKDLHKKLRNVSNTKKLGDTLTIYNAVNFNTFQQRLDKYSQSPERNINGSQDKIVKDLSQAAAKNEKYEKFMKRMEDSQENKASNKFFNAKKNRAEEKNSSTEKFCDTNKTTGSLRKNGFLNGKRIGNDESTNNIHKRIKTHFSPDTKKYATASTTGSIKPHQDERTLYNVKTNQFNAFFNSMNNKLSSTITNNENLNSNQMNIALNKINNINQDKIETITKNHSDLNINQNQSQSNYVKFKERFTTNKAIGKSDISAMALKLINTKSPVSKSKKDLCNFIDSPRSDFNDTNAFGNISKNVANQSSTNNVNKQSNRSGSFTKNSQLFSKFLKSLDFNSNFDSNDSKNSTHKDGFHKDSTDKLENNQSRRRSYNFEKSCDKSKEKSQINVTNLGSSKFSNKQAKNTSQINCSLTRTKNNLTPNIKNATSNLFFGSYSGNNNSTLRATSEKNSPNLMEKKFFSVHEATNDHSRMLRTQHIYNSQSKDFNFSKNCLKSVLNIGSNLINQYVSLLNETDIYNLIKLYIENVQDANVKEIEEAVNNNYKDQDLRNIINAQKLEKWAVMFFFYFTFEKAMMKKMNNVLKFLLRKVCENYYISSTAFFVYSPKNTLSNSKKSQDLVYLKNGIILKQGQKDLLKTLQKNNSEILSILKVCSGYCSSEIQEGFQCFYKNNSSYSLTLGFEKCQESFFTYLNQKNVITLEIINNNNDEKPNQLTNAPKKVYNNYVSCEDENLSTDENKFHKVPSQSKMQEVQSNQNKHHTMRSSSFNENMIGNNDDSENMSTNNEIPSQKDIKSKVDKNIEKSDMLKNKSNPKSCRLELESGLNGDKTTNTVPVTPILNKNETYKQNAKHNKLATSLNGVQSIPRVKNAKKHSHKTKSVSYQEIEELETNAQMFSFQPEIKNSSALDNGPFLPTRIANNKEFTLVIDLDETLVHFQEMDEYGQFFVRPFAPQFLVNMAQYYEIVIFTAAMQEYADWILDKIDVHNVISYRLYRQHTRPKGNVFVKDLNLLGRSLEKMIIIDNSPDNFQQQIENGIFIKSWYHDAEDRALMNLAPLLASIVEKKCFDVRQALRLFKNKMIENNKKGITSNINNLINEQDYISKQKLEF